MSAVTARTVPVNPSANPEQHRTPTTYRRAAPKGTRAAESAGNERELAALGDKAAGVIPDLAVFFQKPPVTNPALGAAQPARSGRARTWAVSSTVDVHATGRRALNAVAGTASTASTGPMVSIGSPRAAETSRARELAAWCAALQVGTAACGYEGGAPRPADPAPDRPAQRHFDTCVNEHRAFRRRGRRARP
jgi:hypothetical protein